MITLWEKASAQNWLVFVLLVVMGCAAYANVLPGPFFFDDPAFIVYNIHVQTFDLEKIYTSGATAGSGLWDNFYRPNAQIIYAILAQIPGDATWPFHAASILLHTTNSFLIFILFILLGVKRVYALIGALLFLLHPIQTQAVSYISGLSEPLAAFTTLLSLVLFTQMLQAEKTKIWQFASILGIATLGFFSKENSLMLSGFMGITLLYLYRQKKIRNLKAGLYTWYGILSLSFIFLLLRLTVFNFSPTDGFNIATISNAYTESLLVRMITFVSILYQYVGMILWPLGLHYETPYIAYTSLITWPGFFGIMVILGGLYLVYKSLMDGSGVFFFSFLWFFIAILPVSGIVATNAIFLEHWLYVPIIGIIFGIVYVLEKLGQNTNRKKMIFSVVCLLLIIYTGIVIDRNRDWADPVKFFSNELKYTQKSARVYNNLAMEIAAAGDCSKAIPYYEKAIETDDRFPHTHNNLANCLVSLGRTTEAILEYEKALHIDPNFIYSVHKLKELEKKEE